MGTPNKKHGDQAEQRAYQFLLGHGLKIITQNYRCKYGEIDLIMQDDKEIVFVEVRSRSNLNYGSAIESVNQSKQKKIRNTSIYFLQQHNWLNTRYYRFDVIGIHHDNLEWVKNAFTTEIL